MQSKSANHTLVSDVKTAKRIDISDRWYSLGHPAIVYAWTMRFAWPPTHCLWIMQFPVEFRARCRVEMRPSNAASCAWLSWPHLAFQSTLNSSVVSYRASSDVHDLSLSLLSRRCGFGSSIYNFEFAGWLHYEDWPLAIVEELCAVIPDFVPEQLRPQPTQGNKLPTQKSCEAN